MVKVLCVLTSDKAHGWYLPELAHPYSRFIKAGFEVTICSILGGSTTVSTPSLDLTDEENNHFWQNEATKSLVETTKPIDEYNGADFDVVFYVGGSNYCPIYTLRYHEISNS